MMKKNKYAIIDYRLSEKCKKSLINYGFSLIELKENNKYDAAVAAHPDIFLFLSENTIIIDKSIKDKFSQQQFSKEREIKFTNQTNVLGGMMLYPNDCTLNFAKIGSYLIGKKDIANNELLKIARAEGYEFINVNQGYAKCNVCIVNDNAIITEDIGIAEACRNNNIDVLLLKTHSVKLDGYNYGFIGGASGTEYRNNNNIVYFCGCIENHPEYIQIKNFCSTHNAQPISLSDEDLHDRGSIFFI